jgi:hypothetical protein
MRRHDVAAIAIGLAAVGFALVLLLVDRLSPSAVQPALAIALAVAGAVALLFSFIRHSPPQ